MKEQIGTFYGIGVGPGDPELLTIKAVNILKKADVIFTASSSKNDFSLAKEIALPYIPEGIPVIRLSFPMTKDKEIAQKAWLENVNNIVAKVEKGKNAVFLTLGDPMVYSTYGYILAIMKTNFPHISIQTIPGITSFQAAASRINKPLVLGDENLLLVAGTDKIREIKDYGDHIKNMVLLKAYKNMDEIAEMLTENKMNEDAVAIRKCGLPDEEVFYDMEEVRKKGNDYWTLILAKKNLE